MSTSFLLYQFSPMAIVIVVVGAAAVVVVVGAAAVHVFSNGHCWCHLHCFLIQQQNGEN